MSLVKLQSRLVKAAHKFAEIIQPVYFSTSHIVLTKSGMKIPNENEIVEIIFGLIRRINGKTDSISSAGIQIEIEKDEDGNILDASIGYVAQLYSLLGEEIEDV